MDILLGLDFFGHISRVFKDSVGHAQMFRYKGALFWRQRAALAGKAVEHPLALSVENGPFGQFRQNVHDITGVPEPRGGSCPRK